MEQERIRNTKEMFGLYQEEIQLLEWMEENNLEKITGININVIKLTLNKRDQLEIPDLEIIG